MSRVFKSKKYVIIFIALIFFTGCSEKKEGNSTKIKAAATILPYTDFIKEVGGNNVEAVFMVPPGSSPESFEPTPRELKEIAGADIYFKVGTNFAFEDVWLEKIKGINPDLKVIDCSEGINVINGNPHVWLDPANVKKITNTIENALNEVKPELSSEFESNKELFDKKIDSVDAVIKTKFASLHKKILMVYHPAWTYFTGRYGLEEMAIENNGNPPKAGDLKLLIDKAKAMQIKAVFIEKQFDPEAAIAIAGEINAAVVQIDPLPEDYLKNLIDTADKIYRYLQ